VATVLIIDDSARARAEIRRALAEVKIFDRILEAENGVAGLKQLVSEPLDIVICDLEMPGLDGEKLLRAKNSCLSGAGLPFVVVTASTDLDRRARLLDRGASDVVSKPFHPPDLVARLQLHLKIRRLQNELMIKNETLGRLSTSDALTGLRTRRYAIDALSIEFLRAQRYKTPFSIIMADIDHFKAVNDTYGHPTGDAVLKGVSSLLLGELRTTDVGGRYGGEEIIVILHHSDIGGAAVLAERWRLATDCARFEGTDGQIVKTSISLGIAEYHESMRSPEELIEAADQALYVAKSNGRNRHEVYQPE
jgi:two-component system cell cycle response regulator